MIGVVPKRLIAHAWRADDVPGESLITQRRSTAPGLGAAPGAETERRSGAAQTYVSTLFLAPTAADADGATEAALEEPS